MERITNLQLRQNKFLLAEFNHLRFFFSPLIPTISNKTDRNDRTFPKIMFNISF